ncbi:MAG: DUF3187 family protein [Planctomycetota bacterium]
MPVAPLLALLACPLVLVGCGGGGEVRPRVRGPLPTRIQQPLGQVFPNPRPRRAQLLEPGTGRATLDLEYSSIFERNVDPGQAASFDGETARVTTRIAYGVGPGTELLVEPAVQFASSGFLDRVVDEFHAFTGFAEGGRDTFPRDQYSMFVENQGRTAWELEENEILLGDLPVTLLVQVRDEDDDGPAIAARVTLEIPTGDESRGGGSGGWDTAAGVLVERSLGRWTLTASLDGVHVDQPRALVEAGVDIRTMLFAAGGVEYRWTDRLSLLGQALFRSPITRSLPFEEIDREILDLGFGAAFDVARDVTLTASFHEDAVAASGPDLTFYLGLAVGF